MVSLQQLVQQAFLLQQVGNLEHAKNIYEQILKQFPNMPDIHNNLANVLQLQKNYFQASYHYQRALQLRPNFAQAHFNLARALESLKKNEQALIHYQYAIDLDLESLDLYLCMARLLTQQEQFQRAIKYYQLALQNHSDQAILYHELGTLLFSQGQSFQALQSFQKAYKLSSSDSIFSNLLFCIRATSNMGYREVFQEVKQRSELAKQPEINSDKQLVSKKLKIGYISTNFYQHSTAAVFEHLFLHHNREHFEIISYPGPEADDPDEATIRFKAMSDHWHPLINKSSEEVFQQIKEDKVDILVDLVGHMEGNQLKALQHKPAPVQVTGLGFGATTGSKAFDYCFLDPYIVSMSEVKYFSEKVYYLNSLLCWKPPGFELKVQKRPWNQKGYLTFGCANSLFKINEEVIELWAQILIAVPNSKLSLKAKHLTYHDIQHYIIERFKTHGINEEQLILTGRSSHEEHLEFYQTLDLALDPFPYDGGVSTCEALWMGVPVLSQGTIAGHSILHQVGLEQMLQKNNKDYLKMAIDLAKAPDVLNQLSRDLRKKLLNSPICNGQAYTQQIEQAYQMMWRQYCDGL